MTHLDLFSGIGGFALAARWAGIETVQFVEYEPYAQKVLAKNFPGVPIAGDIFEFDATKFLGVGLVTGGFPCQPFSQAGKRLGSEDDRAIWPQMLRVIREARPTWVLGENVSGIITMELDNVLSDLEGEGYTTQTLIIPATGVDARHRRERVWIVANSQYSSDRTNGGKEREEESIQGVNRQERCGRLPGRTGSDSRDVADSFNSEQYLSSRPKSCQQPDDRQKWSEVGSKSHGCSDEGREEDVPDSNSIRLNNSLERQEEIRVSNCRDKQTEGQWNVAHSNSKRQQRQGKFKSTICAEEAGKREATRVVDGSGPIIWPTEPGVGRVANGVSSRVDRLKGLGNAIVPAVAYEIIRHMKEVT